MVFVLRGGVDQNSETVRKINDERRESFLLLFLLAVPSVCLALFSECLPAFLHHVATFGDNQPADL